MITHINGPSNWTLSIESQGEILRGIGNEILQWDGRVLPDGTYRLTLTSDTQVAQVPIIIDTQPPLLQPLRFREQEGSKTTDKMREGIANSVAPTLVVNTIDDRAAVQDAADVSLKFSKRADDVEPAFAPDAVKVEPKDARRSTVTYTVPFEEDKLLYFGNQSVEVTVRDAVGSEAKQTYNFAVGANNTGDFAELPDYTNFGDFEPPSSAYRLNFVGPPPLPPPPGSIPAWAQRLPHLCLPIA